MLFDRKWGLLTAVLFATPAVLTVYSWRMYSVVPYIYEGVEFDNPMWRSTPPGCLFPWPTEPGPLEALSTMSESDLIIYRYLVKSSILPVLNVALWIASFLFLVKATKLL